MASKVLLEHYNGIRELNRDDLVFMFSHLFKDVLENITPSFPRFPNTQKEFTGIFGIINSQRIK